MEQLKLFFFDDKEEQYRPIYQRFNLRWHEKYPNIKISHKESNDYYDNEEDALSAITSNFDYQICLVDILAPSALKDEHSREKERLTPVGKYLIQDIKKKKPNSVIVAISNGNIEDYPDLEKDVINSGADYFIYKSQIRNDIEETIKIICESIYQTCSDRGIILNSNIKELEYNEKDPRLSYILSEIGKDNIISLYDKTLAKRGTYEKIIINYLSPGLSGAFVLQIDSITSGSAKASHLLKINRQLVILDNEINNRPLPGRYRHNLFINYLPTIAIAGEKSDQWYAISAPFISGSITFRDWLKREQSSEKIEHLFENIFFNNGLVSGYHEATKTSAENPLELNLSPSRRARILIAIEELDSICREKSLGNVLDWSQKKEKIKKFLLNDFDLNRNLLPDQLYNCDCHGDFHSRNILVNEEMSVIPTLIDTAQFNKFHWTNDFVTLFVDIILTSYDHGVNSHRWENIQSWVDITKKILELNTVESSKVNDTTILSLNWMIDNISKIFPFIFENFNYHKWEFHLAIAIEFLRGSYRNDISIQKRVFALESSYLALEAFNNSLQTFIKETNKGI